MIIDQVTINLRSGNGGNGCAALFKKIGAGNIGWGGDGASGGSVILKVSPHYSDLSKFSRGKKFIAQNGQSGKANNKTGKKGEDLFIYLPIGTLVYDNETKELIADMNKPDMELKILKGGVGGKGNFKRNYATEGEEGVARQVFLDYRIPNDVALLGFPNSGKTALFNALTGKDYKVAEYAFTTHSLVWAKSEYNFKEFVLMDMPAVYQGSAQGRGMGNAFLKHLFRTKIILIVCDEYDKQQEQAEILIDQVKKFDSKLLENKKLFYLTTKVDKISKRENIKNNVFSIYEENTADNLKQEVLKTLRIKK